MRKVLLFALCVAASVVAQAQPTVNNSWTKSQMGILPVKDVNNSNPVALSAQGDMYVTGLFAGDGFSFAGTDLAPIAVSSYLLKYGADGTEKWGVVLAGAATIKAITTDASGNVYIAGNFADVVEFGSTDGKAIEKEGVKMGGAFITEQAASFIAKYDPEGILKAVQSFVPVALPELEATGMYDPLAGDYRFDINTLVYDSGKLYASASYTGLTENNNFSFKGGYFDYFGGGFYYGDLKCGAIFSLNDQLEVSGIIANIGVTGGQSIEEASVSSTSFAIVGGKLYSGFVVSGGQTLTIGSQKQEFNLFQEEGMTEYGYILSVIDLTDGTSALTKKYTTTHDILPNSSIIKSMIAKDNVLLVGGTFNKQLPFDTNKTSVSTNDIYVVGLNPNTLDVNWSAISAFNEGEEKKKNEVFSGMALAGDYVYAIGYSSDIASHAAETPLAFWVNISNGTMTQSNPANLTTGVAALGTKLATAQTKVANDKLENIFSLNEVTGGGGTGISSTEQGAGVSVYPNPVVDVLNFTTPCNVAVINLMGVTVKQAENVSNLNVSDLINGQYIVKVTTEDGTSTVKVIKK
ncbi:T9SS type A sorting domain-containing protein [Bacteroides sp. CG01]|uniref:T9SS type A sorting domain-containing protein n=1 Tax=Bacteroides sp. CG01 TaxID=3096000 RepID=UPI002AFE3A40|nr:T9SS type A sorting domain-containing protein [Bacteroides sp. CG01]